MSDWLLSRKRQKCGREEADEERANRERVSADWTSLCGGMTVAGDSVAAGVLR